MSAARVLLVAIGLPGAVAAQELRPPSPDVTVRIIAAQRIVATGALRSLSPDSVRLADTVRVGGVRPTFYVRERSFARSADQRLERLVRYRRHAGSGALVGSAIGFAVGFAVFKGLASDPDAFGSSGSPTQAGMVGGVLAAIPGALLGAAVGAAARTPVWAPLDVPRVSVGVVLRIP